jgi:hypothetical protein
VGKGGQHEKKQNPSLRGRLGLWESVFQTSFSVLIRPLCPQIALEEGPTAKAYKWFQNRYHIIKPHSRIASERESRLSLRNIGLPIKAFGNDEKLGVNRTKNPLIKVSGFGPAFK